MPLAGLNNSTGSIVTAAPALKTTYTVTGINAACNNSISRAFVSIDVVSLPTLITSGNATVCIGSSTTLTATGANAYTWIPSQGLSSRTNAIVTASPSLTITYIVTGSNGGCNNSAMVKVSVSPLPTVNISVGHNVTINRGETFP